MAFLAPSLRALFTEINQAWPNRDRRTDGWIGDDRHCPGESDHCADSNGVVHAIDIDKDGIDPMFVINRLKLYPFVVRYMNYNRKQYHKRNGYAPRTYTGSNPHTSHVHVSIEHNGIARQYTGGYGIMVFTLPLMPPLESFRDTPQEAYSYAGTALNIGYEFGSHGNLWTGYADVIASVRRR